MPDEDFFHEIRNRLTVIHGNLDLIEFSDMSPASSKFLEVAKAEMAKIETLLNEVENTKDIV